MPTGLGLELTCKFSEHSAGRLLEEGMGITSTPLTGDRLVLVATPSTGVDFVLVLELRARNNGRSTDNVRTDLGG